MSKLESSSVSVSEAMGGEEDVVEEEAATDTVSSSLHPPPSDVYEDDDEEEEDDEEEMEPRLKYERLSSDLRSILSDDSASCIAIHPKMMMLGTHWGKTHQLDAMGNVIGGGGSAGVEHSVTVTQMSIDHIGENVASASIDGKVCVRGLLSSDVDFSANLNKPVRAVSIDPVYFRSGSGRKFMTGDDKVVLHERIFLGRYRQTVLCEGEGPITCIRWRGRFAAWISRKGVRVYDVIEQKIISLIKMEPPRVAGGEQEEEDVPARISWSDQFHLFVAMGDRVRVCEVKTRSAADLASPRGRDLPQHMVEITTSFQLEDSWISGLAPLGKELLVLLTVPKEREENGDAARPQVIVVEPLQPEGFQEVCSDVLSIRGHERYKPKDYHLESLVEDKHFFVVSPRDIVVGKPRDTDDRIDWLLQHDRFAEALAEAEEGSKAGRRSALRRHTVVAVGRLYLDSLLREGAFLEAGQLCVRIFGVNKDLWQEEVFKFARLNQLKAVAPFFPAGGGDQGLRLEPHIYEMALFELLKTDSEAFLNTVRAWRPELYSVSAVVKALVEQLLLHPDEEDLQRALATLFTYQEKFDRAVALYLKLGHDDVFDLIRRHSLYEAVADKVLDLMELDHEEAVKLFLDRMAQLPPESIVERLQFNDIQRFRYLHALHLHSYEESKKYHGQLVELYADFAPDQLMSFLRSSDHYPIQRAYEICEERNLTEEKIFILARMGNTREALQLIIEQLTDIGRAVEFCKEHDDEELWTALIDYSIDKPYFIHVLLHNIGTHVDPTVLINKIEDGVKIPGLRDSLVQIMLDYRLQVSLIEGCQRILVSDCYGLLEKKVNGRQRGQPVDEEAECSVCGGVIVRRGSGSKSGSGSSDGIVIAFRCRHTFHSDCLGDRNECGLCSHKAAGANRTTTINAE